MVITHLVKDAISLAHRFHLCIYCALNWPTLWHGFMSQFRSNRFTFVKMPSD